MKLSKVVEELVEERGLDKNILNDVICEGILAAYKKKYPDVELRVNYDKKNDELEIEVEKTIVTTTQDDITQISLRKSHFINSKFKLGDKIWLAFNAPVGRIEVLKAKQIIANKIREIEASIVYKEFKDKEGSIVHGFVHKCERSGVLVKVQDNLAFLPKSLLIPGDKCIVGYPIRAILKEVLLEPRNESQLILDRASENFVKMLFELEIPEVFEKIVEIKKIARIPGYKTKIIVASSDRNIDPVGTCVGVGGSRVKPILKELGTEKIDIISWTDTFEDLIRDSLKPAKIKRVELLNNKEEAYIYLDEDQRSLAIGRMGQNISLASKLIGVRLNLIQEESKESDKDSEKIEE